MVKPVYQQITLSPIEVLHEYHIIMRYRNQNNLAIEVPNAKIDICMCSFIIPRRLLEIAFPDPLTYSTESVEDSIAKFNKPDTNFRGHGPVEWLSFRRVWFWLSTGLNNI